jgi:hypothetical protein
MKRDRKPQTGATNLSARSTSNNSNDGNSVAVSTTQTSSTNNSTFTRSWAHTIISPEEYKHLAPEETSRLKMTATWKPADVYKRDFLTVNKESYKEYKDYRPHKLIPKTTEEIAEENLKHKAEVEAVDRMCQLVRTSYGTVATMLRSVSLLSTLYYVLIILFIEYSFIRNLVIVLVYMKWINI